MAFLLIFTLFISVFTHSPTEARSARRTEASRLDALRERERTRPQAVVTTPAIAPTTPAESEVLSGEIPPMPAHPNDLTSDQLKLFQTIAGMKPILQSKDRSYIKTAGSLKEILDGKKVGTDYRTLIAQREELQLLVLHVVLTSLSKADILSIPFDAKFAQQDQREALEKGTALIKELYQNQWSRMQLDKLTKAASYALATAARFDEFTDQPLSIGDQQALQDFAKNTNEIKPVKPLIVGLGEAIKALWQRLKNLAPTSAKVRNEVAQLPTNVPEIMSEHDKKALADVYEDARNHADDLLINPTQAAAFKENMGQALDDLLNRESPLVEMHHLSEDIAMILYKNHEGFEADQTLQDELFTEPLFLKDALPVRYERMTNVITNLLSSRAFTQNDMRSWLSPIIKTPIEPFFAGIKAALEKNHITSQERDRLRNAGMTLFALITPQYATLGLASSDHDALVALNTQFDGLSMALAEERDLHDQFQSLLRDTKICIAALAQTMSVSLPSTFVATTEDSYISMVTRRSKDDVSLTTAKTGEVFAVLLGQLTRLMKEKKSIIINTASLYNTLLVTEDSRICEEDIPHKMRTTMNDTQREAMKAYFALRDEIERSVSAVTHVDYATHQWSSTELELAAPIMILISAIFANYPQSDALKRKFLEKKEELFSFISALHTLTELLEQDWRTETMRTSVYLRKLYYPQIYSIADAICDKMARESNADIRYVMIENFDKCLGALIATETADTTSPSDEEQELKTTQLKIRSLALMMPEEKELFTQINGACTQLKAINQTLAQETQKAWADTQQNAIIDDAPRRAYALAMTTLATIVSDAKNRKLAGSNYLISELLFDKMNGTLIVFRSINEQGIASDDIPEGLGADGARATIQFLKAILDNPNNFAYTESSTRKALELQIKQLLDDASVDEAADKTIQNQNARQLYQALRTVAPNLKATTTYGTAAVGIYQLVKSDDARTLISKEPALFNYFFSLECIFNLPDGENIENWMDTALSPLALEAGKALFTTIKENPKDFGYKKDKLVDSLVDKMLAFFTNAIGKVPAGAAAAAEKTVAAKKNEAPKPKDQLALDQLKVYIKENKDKLSDDKGFEEFVKTCLKGITGTFDGSDKRKAVASDTELFNLYFSQDSVAGLIVDPSIFPKILSKSAAESARDLYQTMLGNPKDFGYNESDTKTAIEGKLKEIITNLNGRLAEMKKPGYNEEDLSLYQPMPDPNTHASRSSGFVFNLMPFRDIGDPRDPEKGMGPQFTEESLKANHWTMRQIDLYKYLYKDGFKMMRGYTMAIFRQALITLNAMTKELDKDETIPFLDIESKFKKVILRRILNKKPLENSFHIAVLGISFLPKDFNNDKWKSDREELVQPFFEYLKNNPRKFELRQEQVAKVDIILGWIKDGNAPTAEQDYFNDNNGEMSMQTMMASGMMNPMMGMMGGVNAKAASAMGMSKGNAKALGNATQMGMMGMNPMMMGTMGMNPMMMMGAMGDPSMAMMDMDGSVGNGSGSMTAVRLMLLQNQMSNQFSIMNMQNKMEQKFAEQRAREEANKTQAKLSALENQLAEQKRKEEKAALLAELRSEKTINSPTRRTSTKQRSEFDDIDTNRPAYLGFYEAINQPKQNAPSNDSNADDSLADVLGETLDNDTENTYKVRKLSSSNELMTQRQGVSNLVITTLAG